MAQAGYTPSRFSRVAINHSASTKRSIKQSVNIFREYLCQNGVDPAFENLSTEGLDFQLRNFFAAVRSKDGKILSKSSMNCIKFGLIKYLKAEKDVDISADPEFQKSREVYRAVLVDMEKKGFGRYGGVEHKRYHPISPKDLKKLYNDDLAFNISTPTGLQHKVWFEIVFYLCRRGNENLRAMRRDAFAVATDDTGRKYIYQKTNESYTNQKDAATTDGTVGEGRIYEITGSNMCPVLSFEMYTSRLNPNQEALWQRPATTFLEYDEVWYMDFPLGKSNLARMMSKISSLAKLSKKYTNQSIQDTCITLLDKADIAARHIMRTSGHPSETSIHSCAHRPGNKKKRVMSATLSSAIVAPVTPSSCASFATPVAMPGTVVAENVVFRVQNQLQFYENDVLHGPSSIPNKTIRVPNLSIDSKLS